VEPKANFGQTTGFGFLGRFDRQLSWLTLDAFDFFLVVWCLTAIGKEFHQPDKAVAFSLALTLAFRPSVHSCSLFAERMSYATGMALTAAAVFLVTIVIAVLDRRSAARIFMFPELWRQAHAPEKLFRWQREVERSRLSVRDFGGVRRAAGRLADFEAKWMEILDKYGEPYVHMKDSKYQNHVILSELVELIGWLKDS
jgi:hypothetical protein